jgi:1,4-alpha-glucan branching enzyme
MGYNGVDYFSPEGIFYSPEQLGWRLVVNQRLERFVSGLSQRQACALSDQLNVLSTSPSARIAMIFDLVYNHTGGSFDDRSMWCRQRRTARTTSFFTDHGWARPNFACGMIGIAVSSTMRASF